MNWNAFLTTVISGAITGFADTLANAGHIDKHTLVTAGIGALLGVVNLLRQSPAPTTGK